ncbi:MAG: DNA alkylation response protein, partial [Herminiimonas sp.]|nr:DNA alkylation response protein [Herminiimonas sp.]
VPAEHREMLARRFAQKLVLVAQSCLMRQHAPQDVAESFIASRIDGECGRVYGTLSTPLQQDRIVARAWPGD